MGWTPPPATASMCQSGKCHRPLEPRRGVRSALIWQRACSRFMGSMNEGMSWFASSCGGTKSACFLPTCRPVWSAWRRAEVPIIGPGSCEQYSDSCAYQIVVILAFRGDIEGAFAWLERAYTQRDHGLQAVLHSVFLNNLRGDPCASLEIGACRLNTPRLGGPSCGPLTIM